MVLVAAGEFIMGSAEGEGRAVERPAHTVHLNAFYIDRTEVTVADYRLCLEAETCRFPTSTCQGAPNLDNADQMNHPVVCISWHDARAYCAWAGKRLPTEAEWEKAGRGSAAGASSNRTYPWGEGIDCAMANYLGCVGGTAPVGSYPAGASPYGTLDMAGNVWEWVSDWHAGDYYWHSPGRNPTGPATGGEKVVRGGGWEITPDYLRMAYRSNVSPDTLADYIGFRCVLDAAE
jgi:serine/threonine-protein kinase